MMLCTCQINVSINIVRKKCGVSSSLEELVSNIDASNLKQHLRIIHSDFFFQFKKFNIEDKFRELAISSILLKIIKLLFVSSDYRSLSTLNTNSPNIDHILC